MKLCRTKAHTDSCLNVHVLKSKPKIHCLQRAQLNRNTNKNKNVSKTTSYITAQSTLE